MAWMMRHQFMCKHKLLTLSVVPSLSRFNWFWRTKQQVDSVLLIQVVAGSVMEGASMMFHGDYKKRCLLTILVSQILLLTLLISEIKKSTTAKGIFSTHWLLLGNCDICSEWKILFKNETKQKNGLYWKVELKKSFKLYCQISVRGITKVAKNFVHLAMDESEQNEFNI
jgi:hypothetical protein